MAANAAVPPPAAYRDAQGGSLTAAVAGVVVVDIAVECRGERDPNCVVVFGLVDEDAASKAEAVPVAIRGTVGGRVQQAVARSDRGSALIAHFGVVEHSKQLAVFPADRRVRRARRDFGSFNS